MWQVYLTARCFKSFCCGEFERRSEAEQIAAAARRMFKDAVVRVMFDGGHVIDTSKSYERIQERLRKFNFVLRRGLNGEIFYAVNVSSSSSYALRWSEPVQAWICNPIGGSDQDEAARVLAIALGEIEHG